MPYQYAVSSQKCGQRFHKTNRVIYDSVSLTIRNNQRHKFSNFGEPCTLNSYCEKPRCHTNTRFLLKKNQKTLLASFKDKSCHLQFCESYNKTLEFKVLKNLKFCAFHVIRCLNSCVCLKGPYST